MEYLFSISYKDQSEVYSKVKLLFKINNTEQEDRCTVNKIRTLYILVHPLKKQLHFIKKIQISYVYLQTSSGRTLALKISAIRPEVVLRWLFYERWLSLQVWLR